MKIYKIRNKNTGLFSLGSSHVTETKEWNKNGKTWLKINHLKTHLRQYRHKNYSNKELTNNIPKHWKVIEYDVIETPVNITSAKSYYPLK